MDPKDDRHGRGPKTAKCKKIGQKKTKKWGVREEEGGNGEKKGLYGSERDRASWFPNSGLAIRQCLSVISLLPNFELLGSDGSEVSLNRAPNNSFAKQWMARN